MKELLKLLSNVYNFFTEQRFINQDVPGQNPGQQQESQQKKPTTYEELAKKEEDLEKRQEQLLAMQRDMDLTSPNRDNYTSEQSLQVLGQLNSVRKDLAKVREQQAKLYENAGREVDNRAAQNKLAAKRKATELAKATKLPKLGRIQEVAEKRTERARKFKAPNVMLDAHAHADIPEDAAAQAQANLNSRLNKPNEEERTQQVAVATAEISKDRDNWINSLPTIPAEQSAAVAQKPEAPKVAARQTAAERVVNDAEYQHNIALSALRGQLQAAFEKSFPQGRPDAYGRRKIYDVKPLIKYIEDSANEIYDNGKGVKKFNKFVEQVQKVIENASVDNREKMFTKLNKVLVKYNKQHIGRIEL